MPADELCPALCPPAATPAGECDIMQLCSQESAASSMMPFPSHPAARTPAPRTPFSQEQSSSITPPAAQGSSREGGRSSSPSPADTPSTPQAGAAEDHMLSLQHLLMSERARTLSALEVKAIVFKVWGDGRGVLVGLCWSWAQQQRPRGRGVAAGRARPCCFAAELHLLTA